MDDLHLLDDRALPTLSSACVREPQSNKGNDTKEKKLQLTPNMSLVLLDGCGNLLVSGELFAKLSRGEAAHPVSCKAIIVIRM